MIWSASLIRYSPELPAGTVRSNNSQPGGNAGFSRYVGKSESVHLRFLDFGGMAVQEYGLCTLERSL